MAIEFPERVIDIGDRNREGMYRDFDGEIGTRIGRLFRGDYFNNKFRFVRRDPTGDRPWLDVNIEDADIYTSLGLPDGPITGGTFDISSGMSSINDIPFDISAQELQDTLAEFLFVNALVVKHGSGLFIITRYNDGAEDSLEFDTALLTPPALSGAQAFGVTTPGSVGVRMVEVFRMYQKGYAESSAWTPYLNDGAAITETQAGSATKKAVRVLAFVGKPYDGSLILNFPRSTVIGISATSNIATKQVWQVTVDPSTVALNCASLFFIAYDDVGPVQCWVRCSATGTAPTAPVGGRNLQLTLTTGQSYISAASSIATSLDGDSKFVATSAGNVVTVTQSATGTRAAPYDFNIAAQGVTVAQVTPGSEGALVGKYFVLQEAAGALAVWLGLSGSTVPAGALVYPRQLKATIADNDTAATVAGAIETALDADGSYTATTTGNLVTATDSVGGTRPAPSAGTSGFGITATIAGAGITAEIDFDATAAELQAALQNTWLVRKKGLRYFLTCRTVGVQPAFDLDTSDLVYPNGAEIQLDLDTLALDIACAQSDAEAVSLIFEISIKFDGDTLPSTVYREAVQLYRDLTPGDVA